MKHHKPFLSIRWSIILIIFLTLLEAPLFSQVCKVVYRGRPVDLKDSVLHVPENTVALSDTFYVNAIMEIIPDTTIGPSVFFVIDNSGSMKANSPDGIATDPEGYRYKIANDLIDSLRANCYKVEIGLVVFYQCLYFYYPDDPDYFSILPDQWTPIPNKQGAYIPLYEMNRKYGPLQLTGYEICKKYLATWDNGNFVDLAYYPDYNEWAAHMSASTNVNTGFKAARHAMLKSQHRKSRHFVIFLSDGVVNMPPDSTMNEYVKGKEMPTTFTIFFSNDSLVPGKLLTMNENIKNNEYSNTNKWSKIWTFNSSNYDKLIETLSSNFIGNPHYHIYGDPFNVMINGIAVKDTTWYNNQTFIFQDPIPLTSRENSMECTIFYHVKKDTVIGDTVITLKFDDTTDINYTVKIDSTMDSIPPRLRVHYWDRKLEFYHNDTVITGAYEKLGAIDLRFTEEKIDILYGYKDVSIELTNSAGQDSETVALNDAGAFLTNRIPIRALNANETPTPNNGTLELTVSDTIIAVFRNAKLPLDTIYTSIPFSKNSTFNIHNTNNHLINHGTVTIREPRTQNWYAISFSVHLASGTMPISLVVYDLAGRVVATLVDNKEYANGSYTVSLMDKNLAQGIYFYELTTPLQKLRTKLLLIQ